jgi:hypothetical protein
VDVNYYSRWDCGSGIVRIGCFYAGQIGYPQVK